MSEPMSEPMSEFMSEDEKKAIEVLKYELDKSKVCKKYQNNTVDFLEDLDDYIEAIETVLQNLENYKTITNKQIRYLDKQIRCYDRKINNILELKNQGRNLTSKEKKQLKYELGRKDECVKMKNHLINLVENIIKKEGN